MKKPAHTQSPRTRNAKRPAPQFNSNIPPDIRNALGTDLHPTFTAMPPSHQREYLKHIAEAKKPETRASRIQSLLQAMQKRQSA